MGQGLLTGVRLLVLVMLVTGCGVLPAAEPEWVVNRQPLPSCGEETYADGETNLEARQCLLEAFRDGRGAEMISTQQITAERVVTHYLRVHENGTIERFTDATRDPLTSGGWTRERCGEMLGAEEVRDVWVGEVFIILGCTEEPVS
jgi:hypothetical protein